MGASFDTPSTGLPSNALPTNALRPSETHLGDVAHLRDVLKTDIAVAAKRADQRPPGLR